MSRHSDPIRNNVWTAAALDVGNFSRYLQNPSLKYITVNTVLERAEFSNVDLIKNMLWLAAVIYQNPCLLCKTDQPDQL